MLLKKCFLTSLGFPHSCSSSYQITQTQSSWLRTQGSDVNATQCGKGSGSTFEMLWPFRNLLIWRPGSWSLIVTCHHTCNRLLWPSSVSSSSSSMSISNSGISSSWKAMRNNRSDINISLLLLETGLFWKTVCTLLCSGGKTCGATKTFLPRRKENDASLFVSSNAP